MLRVLLCLCTLCPFAGLRATQPKQQTWAAWKNATFAGWRLEEMRPEMREAEKRGKERRPGRKVRVRMLSQIVRAWLAEL
jgi:hypothetical protein